MKILGISGGSRNGGNDTMCKEALRGAKLQGAEIEFIRLMDLDIRHCSGCLTCTRSLMGGKGNLCVIKDDFDWLLDKFYDADGIVFSIPVFEKGAAGVFKSLMDRAGSRVGRLSNRAAWDLAQKGQGKPIDERIFKDKVVAYMGLGGSEWTYGTQTNFGVHALLPLWKIIHNEVFQWSTGIIMQDDRLTKANQIGVDLAKAAMDIENAKYKGEAGVCPHCHSRHFYITGKDNAVCCQCGIEGKILIENNELTFKFDNEQLKRAHDTLEGQMIHADDISKAITKVMELVKTDEYNKRFMEYKDFITATKPEKTRIHA